MENIPYTGIMTFALTIAVAIWVKRRLLKEVNNPKTYPDYLLKLSAITGKNQHDFFIIAGEECNVPTYLINRDWQIYIKTSKMPDYLIDFLDEGKEHIDEAQVLV